MNLNLNATVDVVVDHASRWFLRVAVLESRQIDAFVSTPDWCRACGVNVNDQGGVHVQVHVNVRVNVGVAN